jgi:hypothetical protein
MRTQIDGPPRRHYVSANKHPFLFYAVYGRVDNTKALSRGKYRSDGIGVIAYGPQASEISPSIGNT